jgi:hypothetical protein
MVDPRPRRRSITGPVPRRGHADAHRGACNAPCVAAATTRPSRPGARTGKIPVVEPFPEARSRPRGPAVAAPVRPRSVPWGGRPDTNGPRTRTMGPYG